MPYVSKSVQQCKQPNFILASKWWHVPRSEDRSMPQILCLQMQIFFLLIRCAIDCFCVHGTDIFYCIMLSLSFYYLVFLFFWSSLSFQFVEHGLLMSIGRSRLWERSVSVRIAIASLLIVLSCIVAGVVRHNGMFRMGNGIAAPPQKLGGASLISLYLAEVK